MAKTQLPKNLTKKHLARQQREDMQTRYIVIISIAVIAIVVVLMGAGLLNQYVLQPNRTVAEVNGDKISLNEFQSAVRYQRSNIIQYYQNLSIYFGDNNEQLIQQMQQQLSDTQGIGQSALDSLIEDRLIRQEAKRRGITVTSAEVDKALEEAFGYYPDGRPTETATVEPLATSTLTSLQSTLTAPTATIVPTTTLPTATATLPPTPTASVVLTPTATATPYTKDAYQENYNAQVDSIKTDVGISEKDFRRSFESQLYREKVMEAVLAEMEIPAEEEQIWARHILVTDPVTATLVINQFDAGGDFAALASQYSTDFNTSFDGGDMGWFGKGEKEAAFEAAAWSLSVGEVVSQPVQTSSGYEIIQLLGKEVRPLDSYAYEQLRQTKFTEWLAEQRKQVEDALKLIIHDFWTTEIPIEP